MSFTGEEITYLQSQPLARLATVDAGGQPDVVPVGFEFDGTVFYVGGIDLTATRKYRNIHAGDAKVALVVDDLASTDPWAPRFVRVYGRADIVEREGRIGAASYLRIIPEISWSANLDGRPFSQGGERRRPRRTVHD